MYIVAYIVKEHLLIYDHVKLHPTTPCIRLNRTEKAHKHWVYGPFLFYGGEDGI